MKSEVFRDFAFLFCLLCLHRHFKIRFFIIACFHADEAVIEEIHLHSQDFLIQKFISSVMTIVNDDCVHLLDSLEKEWNDD